MEIEVRPELIDVEIKQSTFIRASPERVYDAFTKAEHLDGWFTTGASVDPKPGGYILFKWKDWGPDHVTAEEKCPVLEARRPERLVFLWHTDNPSYATTIEIDFQPVADGTIVRLREHGYQNTPSGRRAMLDCATGWGEALTLLKFYVEHGLRY